MLLVAVEVNNDFLVSSKISKKLEFVSVSIHEFTLAQREYKMSWISWGGGVNTDMQIQCH